MRKLLIYLGLILIINFLTGCYPVKTSSTDALSGATTSKLSSRNSLFHNTPGIQLETGELKIEGEIQHPGKIDFNKFYHREVFVKETMINNKNEPEFIGAYRYSGYSLFDLLNEYVPAKKNAAIFRPEIDLYIKVENDHGDYVVFSWSEIFHTINPHQIIIATEVAQIKPHKKEINYPVGKTWKIVAANDLYAFRNLENPVKITVCSFDKKVYTINRDLHTLYSPELKVIKESNSPANPVIEFTIHQPLSSERIANYSSTFYGMGMGYHPVPGFSGFLLQDILKDSLNLVTGTSISKGLACFVSIDGYRAIFSNSELFNRVDQCQPMLSIVENPNDGGYFRIFLPTDFYADRSVKGLSEIYFFEVK